MVTRVDPTTAKGSTIDLVLGSGKMGLGSVETGKYLGSDHIPILVKFGIKVDTCTKTKKRWKIAPGNVHKFKDILHEMEEIETGNSSVMYVEKFSKISSYFE